MKFKFVKMHGAGNDFIVVENLKNHYTSWEPQFVKKICTPHTGIGADGLLVLERSKNAAFRMRFFNSDGFESDMCINGSRCICRFACDLEVAGDCFEFEAGDGMHRAQIISDTEVKVEVRLPKDHDPRTFPVEFNLPENIYFKRFLNTGVPHLVLSVKNIENVDVEKTGSQLRFHPYYSPQGTNVNFVQEISEKPQLRLRVRTYERGVDAETLSCGTGSAAAALSYADALLSGSGSVRVETRGGQLLVLSGRGKKGVYVQGPVKYIYKGTYL